MTNKERKRFEKKRQRAKDVKKQSLEMREKLRKKRKVEEPEESFERPLDELKVTPKRNIPFEHCKMDKSQKDLEIKQKLMKNMQILRALEDEYDKEKSMVSNKILNEE